MNLYFITFFVNNRGDVVIATCNREVWSMSLYMFYQIVFVIYIPILIICLRHPLTLDAITGVDNTGHINQNH